MEKKCESCTSCGMPFKKPEDHALGKEDSPYCAYCVRPDGSLKTYQEILQGVAEFFVDAQGIDPKAARQMAQKMLKQLPLWSDQSDEV